MVLVQVLQEVSDGSLWGHHPGLVVEYQAPIWDVGDRYLLPDLLELVGRVLWVELVDVLLGGEASMMS